jgi:hypothetical protein
LWYVYFQGELNYVLKKVSFLGVGFHLRNRNSGMRGILMVHIKACSVCKGVGRWGKYDRKTEVYSEGTCPDCGGSGLIGKIQKTNVDHIKKVVEIILVIIVILIVGYNFYRVTQSNKQVQDLREWKTVTDDLLKPLKP